VTPGVSQAPSPARLRPGRRLLPLAIALALAVVVLAVECARTQREARAVAREIRARVLHHRLALRAPEAWEDRRTWSLVAGTYQRRGFRPLWSDGRRPGEQAEQLVRAIGAAALHGLEPEDYGLAALSSSLQRHRRIARLVAGGDEKVLADLDVTMSYACALYAWHLLHGRVPLSTLDPDWSRTSDPEHLERRIAEAAKKRRVGEMLNDLLPREPGYARLLAALARLREIEDRGGWPPLSRGGRLRPGSRGPRVAELSARLAASADLPAGAATLRASYDSVLARAVLGFQARHGLDTTGGVDAVTRAALDVPVEERIREVELNLERRRWLPDDLGDPRVEVNVPDCSLAAIENGRPVLAMRVVVGRPESMTPIFSARIGSAELDPAWTVPKSIVVGEIVPALGRDPHYLDRSHMRVLRVAGRDTFEADALDVPWQDAADARFAYRVRQDPGPDNPLGRIKFVCPNEYDVYLHDTPARSLFAAVGRDRSHGCIRLERAAEFGDRLLQLARSDSTQTFEEMLAQGGIPRVRFRKPVPVHVLYWTAWVDEAGDFQFRPDIYGLDARLDAALRDRRTARFVLNPPTEAAGP
jgi:murein L,D-transpeptidase YcbB/YkuD